ncbi:hypothetical protein AGLY_002193 [Aphis glycines]|uniref:Uncharacterized protein n=1 Tax=Aphis glycines TaxID=307491 RepID=A0A6G0U379_APHGL|nr:hypothetical protein AGLY_002193 [Aphis glycines]
MTTKPKVTIQKINGRRDNRYLKTYADDNDVAVELTGRLRSESFFVHPFLDTYTVQQRDTQRRATFFGINFKFSSNDIYIYIPIKIYLILLLSYDLYKYTGNGIRNRGLIYDTSALLNIFLSLKTNNIVVKKKYFTGKFTNQKRHQNIQNISYNILSNDLTKVCYIIVYKCMYVKNFHNKNIKALTTIWLPFILFLLTIRKKTFRFLNRLLQNKHFNFTSFFTIICQDTLYLLLFSLWFNWFFSSLYHLNTILCNGSFITKYIVDIKSPENGNKVSDLNNNMSTNQYVRKDILKLSLSYYWHINIISKYCVHLIVHKIINYINTKKKNAYKVSQMVIIPMNHHLEQWRHQLMILLVALVHYNSTFHPLNKMGHIVYSSFSRVNDSSVKHLDFVFEFSTLTRHRAIKCTVCIIWRVYSTRCISGCNCFCNKVLFSPTVLFICISQFLMLPHSKQNLASKFQNSRSNSAFFLMTSLSYHLKFLDHAEHFLMPNFLRPWQQHILHDPLPFVRAQQE